MGILLPMMMQYMDGGTADGNPTGYSVESAAITLVNPTREGYDFTGWSGTGPVSYTHLDVYKRQWEEGAHGTIHTRTIERPACGAWADACLLYTSRCV